MGWKGDIRKSLKKFRHGSVYKDLKNMGMGMLQDYANSNAAAGTGMYTGVGRYKRKKAYKSKHSYKKGRGMYTGSGAYAGKKRYYGRGSYTPARNALISGSKSTQDIVPTFRTRPDIESDIFIREEYVAEVYAPPLVDGGSTLIPFSIQEYHINPGLEKTFPWLSEVASNYEEYEIQKLIFTFKSTTTESGNQTNGQVGTVIMATNYNAASGPFRDKNVMIQYAGACSSRLTESMIHGVECNPNKNSGSKGLYIRTNPVVTGQDLKTYDHGIFQIAIANCTSNLANQSLGELWVSYQIKCRKPKFYTSLGYAITKDIFLSNPNETCLMKYNLGYQTLLGQQNNMGCRIVSMGGFTTSTSLQEAGFLYSGGIIAPNAFYTGTGIDITFPAAYAGNIRIRWAIKYNSGGTIPTGFLAKRQGNVGENFDLYGGAATVLDLNNTGARAANVIIFSYEEAGVTYSMLELEAHVNVQIATNGIDNSVQFFWPGELINQTVVQSYVEVGEYNAGFSYLNTNLGSSTNSVWVNSSGTIIPIPEGG